MTLRRNWREGDFSNLFILLKRIISMHKVIQKPDGSAVAVEQEKEISVTASTEQMGQSQEQPEESQNPAFDFIDKMAGMGDNNMEQETKDFEREQAEEKKKLDEFAKI
jgi:hypothetical protein